ncbi:MAG: hypothetical protein WC640_01480 [Candidatus Paceibacterota bacterium]
MFRSLLNGIVLSGRITKTQKEAIICLVYLTSPLEVGRLGTYLEDLRIFDRLTEGEERDLLGFAAEMRKRMK